MKFRLTLALSLGVLANACSAHVSTSGGDSSQIPGITPQSNTASLPSSNSGNISESAGAAPATGVHSAPEGKWARLCYKVDGFDLRFTAEYEFRGSRYKSTSTTYGSSDCSSQGQAMVDMGTFTIPASGQLNMTSDFDGQTRSDIYEIKNGVMYLGDGASPEKAGRPTSFDYNKPFSYYDEIGHSLATSAPSGSASPVSVTPIPCVGTEDWQSTVGAVCMNGGYYSFLDFGKSRIQQPETLTITVYDGNAQRLDAASNPTVQRSSSSQFSLDFGNNSNGHEILKFDGIDISSAPPLFGTSTVVEASEGLCTFVSAGDPVSCFKAVMDDYSPDSGDYLFLP